MESIQINFNFNNLNTLPNKTTKIYEKPFTHNRQLTFFIHKHTAHYAFHLTKPRTGITIVPLCRGVERKKCIEEDAQKKMITHKSCITLSPTPQALKTIPAIQTQYPVFVGDINSQIISI